MNSVKSTLITLIIVAVLITGGIWGGYFWGSHAAEKDAKIVLQNDVKKVDLILPTEVEKKVVTLDEVKSALAPIAEFNTYCSEYTVERSEDEARYIGNDIKIPGTTNTISIKCTGVVKVGCEFKELVVVMDEENKTIQIGLPDMEVTNNYIIWDTVKIVEENNILNPINSDQYENLIKEIEAEGLTDAEKNDIYAKAESNMKTLINGFLKCFADDYIIKYV